MSRFFDRARHVSDETGQEAWARILAGEANRPGSFSIRTVIAMESLTKQEGELVRALGGFVWSLAGWPVPYINDFTNELYKSHGVGFQQLMHLDAIGLGRFEPQSPFISTPPTNPCELEYFGRRIRMTADGHAPQLPSGTLAPTAILRELLAITDAEAVPGFFEYSIDKWRRSFKLEIL